MFQGTKFVIKSGAELAMQLRMAARAESAHELVNHVGAGELIQSCAGK